MSLEDTSQIAIRWKPNANFGSLVKFGELIKFDDFAQFGEKNLLFQLRCDVIFMSCPILYGNYQQAKQYDYVPCYGIGWNESVFLIMEMFLLFV